jgi:hypothetical protein
VKKFVGQVFATTPVHNQAARKRPRKSRGSQPPISTDTNALLGDEFYNTVYAFFWRRDFLTERLFLLIT